MPLNPVGLYREMYNGKHAELPSIHDSFSELRIEDRDSVLAYMRSAPVVFDVLDVADDLIDGADRIMSASSLISDGTWIWRLDSIYYLSRYDLGFPEDFLRHVRRLDYRAPEQLDFTPELHADLLVYF
ncbi:hypothetical protein [Nocardia sp. NPDC057668]|uniref:hypothetical protein n=1 Tax=Nocardia sp. NPDC057668 TaxID=3346202 RepID=UPI00366DAAF5